MQASSLKSCGACRIGGLPGGVAIRLGLLLSSLSLCLRFGSLTQFPPTLDLYRFAIACRGGFAGARRSTHYQDDMHCQMIRLHQNKMSRAAADDRSRPNRIAMLTRLRRAQGSAIGKRRISSSCLPAMGNAFLLDGRRPFSFSGKKMGVAFVQRLRRCFPRGACAALQNAY